MHHMDPFGLDSRLVVDSPAVARSPVEQVSDLEVDNGQLVDRIAADRILADHILADHILAGRILGGRILAGRILAEEAVDILRIQAAVSDLDSRLVEDCRIADVVGEHLGRILDCILRRLGCKSHQQTLCSV